MDHEPAQPFICAHPRVSVEICAALGFLFPGISSPFFVMSILGLAMELVGAAIFIFTVDRDPSLREILTMLFALVLAVGGAIVRSRAKRN